MFFNNEKSTILIMKTNPREAQDRDAIETRDAEVYSLRQVIVEALVSNVNEEKNQVELTNAIE